MLLCLPLQWAEAGRAQPKTLGGVIMALSSKAVQERLNEVSDLRKGMTSENPTTVVRYHCPGGDDFIALGKTLEKLGYEEVGPDTTGSVSFNWEDRRFYSDSAQRKVQVLNGADHAAPVLVVYGTEDSVKAIEEAAGLQINHLAMAQAATKAHIRREARNNAFADNLAQIMPGWAPSAS